MDKMIIIAASYFIEPLSLFIIGIIRVTGSPDWVVFKASNIPFWLVIVLYLGLVSLWRPKREKMISEFQDPQNEPSAFVLSLKAGGVGITLTKANHVFHFDRWWNPAVENQATDRAFRIGQQKNVFVHKFVTLGTLEERIDEMIEDKKKIANSIVGSDESWLTELDNESFKKLIALNRQAIV
jgi:hypothetical protein